VSFSPVSTEVKANILLENVENHMTSHDAVVIHL
jgi:hypothetical protein